MFRNNIKYDIILISEGKLKDALDDNILPLLPMLREAKPLINKEFIDRYSKEIVTKKNLSFHFETTKSAMSVVWADIELKREQGKKYVEDASAYSLILRLRELYIVECLLKCISCPKCQNNSRYKTYCSNYK